MVVADSGQGSAPSTRTGLFAANNLVLVAARRGGLDTANGGMQRHVGGSPIAARGRREGFTTNEPAGEAARRRGLQARRVGVQNRIFAEVGIALG